MALSEVTEHVERLKIVGAIRVGESATADTAENPMRERNPGRLDLEKNPRVARLSRRIANGGF